MHLIEMRSVEELVPAATTQTVGGED